MRISDWSSDVCSSDLRKFRSPAAIIGENLEVIPAPVTASLEGAKQCGYVHDPVARKQAVGEATRRLAPVIVLNAEDARCEPLRIRNDIVLIPEMVEDRKITRLNSSH